MFVFFQKLVQVLERACEEIIHMDIIDVDESGYALRFSPYDCKSFPTMENLKKFLENFDQQLVFIISIFLYIRLSFILFFFFVVVFFLGNFKCDRTTQKNS